MPSQAPAALVLLNRDLALRLAAKGFCVFPAHAGGPDMKRPIPGVFWRSASTTDADQVARWWSRWPDAMPAIDLAKAGLLVIDADRHGGPDGVAAWEALCKQHGFAPDENSCCATAGGGVHFYFRQPTKLLGNARGGLPKGVDCKGVGGYTIAPGAARADGRSYGAADLTDPPPVPDWLEKTIRQTPEPPPAVAIVPAVKTVPAPASPARIASYAHAAIEAEVAALRGAITGERNNTLNTVAFKFGQMIGAGWLSEAEALSILETGAAEIGLVKDDGIRSVRATIRSGLRSGVKEPRKEPADRPGDGNDYGLSAWIERDGELFNPDTGEIVERTLVPGTARGLPLRWHGEAPPAPPLWLVRNLIPETGTGLLSGQWGTGKTFVAIDLSVSVMAGTPFAGQPVVRKGGVLFVAAEGSNQIALRLDGVVRGKIEPAGLAPALAGQEGNASGALPFAWAEECPPLTKDGAVTTLIETAAVASERIQAEHGVSLALIIVDTMSAAAGFADENDSAEAQRVMNALAMLSRNTGAFVLAVDHFGKIAETGTRGSSAKEAAADVVLALGADREQGGSISNTRLMARKVRGGASGQEVPYSLQVIGLGDDATGEPITTCTVLWSPPNASAEPSSPTSERWPRSSKVFRSALVNALAEGGLELRPFGNEGGRVRAASVMAVRKEFALSYPADGETKEKQAEAKRKAFNRGLQTALERNLVASREIDGTDYVWFASILDEATDADTMDE